MTELQTKIDAAFEDRALLQQDDYREAVLTAVEMLDKGEARIAEDAVDVAPLIDDVVDDPGRRRRQDHRRIRGFLRCP